MITQTFASWEIDYLKVDGCFSDPSTFDVGYPKFTEALNATGRPILLSCEWPDYQQKIGIKVCKSNSQMGGKVELIGSMTSNKIN